MNTIRKSVKNILACVVSLVLVMCMCRGKRDEFQHFASLSILHLHRSSSWLGGEERTRGVL